MLHIPTFNVMEAWVGLLAGMCCVGACYTDSVPPADVRNIMDSLALALQVKSRLFSYLAEDPPPQVQNPPFGSRKTDVEELQAIMLSQALHTWHGTPSQRKRARGLFPFIASFASRSGLLQLSRTPSLYSPAHEPDFSPQIFNTATFDWASWVEQEKYTRLFYFVFLSDAAYGLYFNCGPELDALRIPLPLPADDAAWDARNAVECADALGLHGPELLRWRNHDGTRHCNQPSLHMVLKTLFNSSYQLPPGSTNLYGKFIVIHALLGIMRRAQLDGGASLLSGSNTPLPQHAWFEVTSGSPVAILSRRCTPVHADANLLDPEAVKRFAMALERFKFSWDNDMAIQFPPNIPSPSRRYGFCRDGIHFYWVASYLLKNARAADLQLPADNRFAQIMHLLRSVKTWVASDAHARGEELGSVSEIAATYGATGPDLDMTQLFRPVSPPRPIKAEGLVAA